MKSEESPILLTNTPSGNSKFNIIMAYINTLLFVYLFLFNTWLNNLPLGGISRAIYDLIWQGINGPLRKESSSTALSEIAVIFFILSVTFTTI